MRIIVTGLIAQHYRLGGVTWDYLQYAVGLKQLGHDVYYFEDSGEWPYNTDGGETGKDWVARDCNENITYLKNVLSRYDLSDRWAYHFPLKSKWYGLSDVKRKSVLETADLLINVSGTLEKPENYSSVKRMAYIDSDPGFTQVKMQLKEEDFIKRVAAHHIHFSFGECLGDSFKNLGYDWKPTRTPIVLSDWMSSEHYRNVYTTVMSWTSYKPLVYEGKFYNQKDIEFMKFLEVKRKLGDVSLEVAISKLQHKNWQTSVNGFPNISEINRFQHPADLLSFYGWKIADTDDTCGDLDSYRDYIIRSKGEWSVAKGGYVVSNSGWFSCRSACYLAAGRPVIVQSTGFDKVLPVGEGILQFSTTEEAIDAIGDVEARYDLHAKRAREIAGEYFDASKVLKHLIERALNF